LRFSNDVCSAPDSWKTRNSDKNLVPICLYCLKCTKFGQLVLAKIIKIVDTRCQILRLKCTKFEVDTPKFLPGSSPMAPSHWSECQWEQTRGRQSQPTGKESGSVFSSAQYGPGSQFGNL